MKLKNNYIHELIFQACTVVATAATISGGFFNPVLAMITFHKCKKFRIPKHILIYWIPALLGSTVSYKIYPNVRTYVYDFFDFVLRKEKKWHQSPFTSLNKSHRDKID